jgi:hypothetical protein
VITRGARRLRFLRAGRSNHSAADVQAHDSLGCEASSPSGDLSTAPEREHCCQPCPRTRVRQRHAVGGEDPSGGSTVANPWPPGARRAAGVAHGPAQCAVHTGGLDGHDQGKCSMLPDARPYCRAGVGAGRDSDGDKPRDRDEPAPVEQPGMPAPNASSIRAKWQIATRSYRLGSSTCDAIYLPTRRPCATPTSVAWRKW